MIPLRDLDCLISHFSILPLILDTLIEICGSLFTERSKDLFDINIYCYEVAILFSPS